MDLRRRGPGITGHEKRTPTALKLAALRQNPHGSHVIDLEWEKQGVFDDLLDGGDDQ